MSCSCGCSPCYCSPRCPESCPEELAYTGSNINLSGVGVFDALVSQEFQFRGIRSTNGNITVALNNALHTIDLTISEATFQTTTTFENEATRGNTVPDFVGQVGVQLDTNVIYTSTGLNAGDWVTTQFFIAGQVNTVTSGSTNVVLNGGSGIDISSGDLTGTVTFQGVAITLGLATTLDMSTTGTITGAVGSTIIFGGFQQWTTDTRFYMGAIIPASSVFCTTSTAGQGTSKPISQFLSTDNQVAYDEPTGTEDRTTFDTATVTLPELAQRVFALIHDLKITVKPT